MKKARYYIGIAVVVIGAVIYGAQLLFNIDIVALVIPDNEKPTIDVSSIRTTVTLDGEFDISGVTCEDNYDDDCEVVVSGSIDTSSLGTQSITFRATDKAGNTATESIMVSIIEGIDTTMYVPSGYYDGISGLSGEALKNALNDIVNSDFNTPEIDGHKEYDYTHSTKIDVWDILRDADEDPNNPDNIISIYTGLSIPKDCQDGSSTKEECTFETLDEEDNEVYEYHFWNREHIWSKSHGAFTADNEARGAHTDAHHLVAEEKSVNSTKNNRFFTVCEDANMDENDNREFDNWTCDEWYFEPRDEVKGDVARMLFYMVIRYEGESGLLDDYVDLELTNDLYQYENSAISIQDSKAPYYESLSILLQWHIDDPVDQKELDRNETIFGYQGNRNPFIDHPELVELIWGTPESPIEYISTTSPE